jgi:peptidyl-prolyl cis-trans isomerase C
MRTSLSFVLLPIVAAFFPGCALWEGELPESLLAQVNGEPITLEDFHLEFRQWIPAPDRDGERADQVALKEACLNHLIERKLLVQEARRSGISLLTEELDQAVLEIRKDYPGGSFEESLGLRGITLDALRGQMEEKLLTEKVVRAALRYEGEIDEKEALRYYDLHRSSFQISARVRVRQIVVSDGEEAIQILKRLKKGERFEKLAIEKSLGPERTLGGDLGFFGKGERPEAFDKVFAMEPGTLSEVIRSPYGYHIFKMEEMRQPRSVSYEEARPRILQELRREKGEEAYQKWLKDLREHAKIRVNRRWLALSTALNSAFVGGDRKTS